MPAPEPSPIPPSSTDAEVAPEPDGNQGAAATARGDRIRRYLLGVCVLFTTLTVVSSSLALARGEQTDTHRHLLLRLLFVMLGLGAYELVVTLRRRFPQLPWAVVVLLGSASLLGAVVAALWIAGQSGVELHPDAYRDAVLNVAAVGLGLTVLAAVAERIRRRR